MLKSLLSIINYKNVDLLIPPMLMKMSFDNVDEDAILLVLNVVNEIMYKQNGMDV